MIIRLPYPDVAAGGGTRNKRMGEISNLIGYHSVADSSTMTLDGSNGVSEWRARDGSTILQQTNAARRPPYVASVSSIGDKPALMLTADSRMEFTTPGVFPKDTMGHTILMLYRGTVNKQNVLILSWGSGAGPWRLAGYGNSGTNTWAAMPLGDHNSTNSALNVTSLMVHTMASGANPVSTHYVNGGAGQTKSFSGTPSNGATGASIGWTQFYDVINAEGVILEALAVFNGVLSTSDRQDAEGIMAWEHGQQGLLIGGPYMTSRPTTPA